MEVPDEYKVQQRVPIKTKRLILIMLTIMLVILAIPAAIYLNFHFYFNNTLSAEGIALEQNEEQEKSEEIKESSLENGPVQIKVVGDNGKKESGSYKGREINITYKYYYDITGVVTSVRDFWGFDDYAALVPRDVCLTWGSLAETFLNGGATFHQSYRYCFGKATGEDAKEAETFEFKTPFGQKRSSLALMSNNHLIASNVDIRNQILDLKAKDKVRIRGYLVNVAYNGILLESSERRDDAGNGACEVIYVTSIENSGQASASN